MDRDDITFGGFIPSNIRRYLIKECLESGDPENMFLALQEAMDYLNDQMNETTDKEFWELAYSAWLEGKI